MKQIVTVGVLLLACTGCTVLSVAGTVVSTTASVVGTVVETGVSVTGSVVKGVANSLSSGPDDKTKN
jgi:hypothetical protein